MDKFTARRLAQMEPIGAIMQRRGYGCHLGRETWQSLVMFQGEPWTRVRVGDVVVHYRGRLDMDEAAQRALDEIPD